MDIEQRVAKLERELDRRFPMKECPRCDAEVSMIEVETWANKRDGENFLGYRCLKCGTVYKEILQEQPVEKT